MQAIRTKYHGPSNTRGSYMTADAESGTVKMSYNHSLSVSDNHAAVCQAYITKMGWDSYGVLLVVVTAIINFGLVPTIPTRLIYKHYA